MTNLEAIRLLNAKGMAKFIADERLSAIKQLSENKEIDEIIHLDVIDLDELQKECEKIILVWLNKEYKY